MHPMMHFALTGDAKPGLGQQFLDEDSQSRPCANTLHNGRQPAPHRERQREFLTVLPTSNWATLSANQDA